MNRKERGRTRDDDARLQQTTYHLEVVLELDNSIAADQIGRLDMKGQWFFQPATLAENIGLETHRRVGNQGQLARG